MSKASDVLDQMIADPSINGQHVDVDHQFGGQCWDLVELFAERLGVPREPWAIPLGPEKSAKEAWTYYDQSPHMQRYFDRIPKGVEQKGDINVYGPHGAYTEGHIAISLGGGRVFEENADPDGSPAHVSARAPTYLLGSLRLKGGKENMASNATFEDAKRMATVFFGKDIIAAQGGDSWLQGFVGTPLPDLIKAWAESDLSLTFRRQVESALAKPSSVKPYDGPQLFTKG